MAPLATAFIRLRSDSSTLAGDVRRDATKAGAEGGAVMGREFGTAFRRVSRTLIGLGIGTFAVEAGRFAIDMADKFELSRSRLETVTKNLGGDFSAVSGQVQALDDRLAAFGFTNADVEGSVASLETATKSTGKAIADAALAADIARGRNISLEAATQILMRVETGHVAMLSRLGIATKDASGHLLTQKAALEQLAAIYGGSASHFAETFAGKQQALRAELGNSAAEIGVALLPAVVDLAKVLQHDILPAVQSSAEFFDRNRKTIEPLVGILLKLALAYKAVKLAQKGLAAISVARGAGAAAGAAGVGGASALGAEAFSLTHPLPVFVTNQGGGVKPSGAVVTPAEEAAGAGGAGIFTKLLPTATEGLLKITAPVFAAFEAYKLQQNVRAGQKSGGVLGTVGAGASSLGHLIGKTGDILGIGGGLTSLGSLLGIAGHANKVGAQQTAITSVAHSMGFLGNVTHIVTAAEHGLGGAVGTTTGNLKDQAKALAFNQSKALALGQGADDLRSAVHNMAETVGQQSSQALKGNSDAAIANRSALRGAVTQAQAYLTTMKQQHLSQARVAQTAVALAQAIEKNATATYGNRQQVVALLKQLGFLPGQIRAALEPSIGIGESIGEGIMNGLAIGIANATPVAVQQAKIGASQALKSARFAAGLDAGTAAGSLIPPATKKKAKDAGVQFANSVVGGYTPVVDSGIGAASTAAADKAQQAFDAAKSKMQADFQTIKQFYAAQKQSLVSSFETFSTTPGQDSLGASFGQPPSVLSQLRASARQMDQFVHLYKRLEHRGLDQHLLGMFQALGPEGIPQMRQLLQGGARSIRRADRLDRRIQRDASGLATRETQDRYGRLIHDDLKTLPHKLAVELDHKLRHMHIDVSLKHVARDRGRRVRNKS